MLHSVFCWVRTAEAALMVASSSPRGFGTGILAGGTAVGTIATGDTSAKRLFGSTSEWPSSELTSSHMGRMYIAMLASVDLTIPACTYASSSEGEAGERQCPVRAARCYVHD